MVCSSCELKVKTALTELPEVISVTTSHTSGETTILMDAREDRGEVLKKVNAAVTQLGYHISSRLNVLDYKFKGNGDT